MDNQTKKTFRLDGKNKIYLILALFVLVAMLFIIFFVWPCFVEIKNLSQDLVFQKNQFYSFNAQILQVANFKKEYGDYSDNLGKISQAFISLQSPVDFIEFLEKSASDSNVELQVYPPSVPDKISNTAIFQLSCTGTFSSVIDFSNRLEKSQYFIKIENVSIKNFSDKKTGKKIANEIQVNYSIKVLAK